MRVAGIVLVLLGAFGLGFAALASGGPEAWIVGAALLAGGIILLAADARRRGRAFPAVRTAGTIVGGLVMGGGALLVVIGLALMIFIVTAPFGLVALLLGAAVMLLGASVAGVSWIPGRRQRAR